MTEEEKNTKLYFHFHIYFFVFVCVCVCVSAYVSKTRVAACFTSESSTLFIILF